MTAGDSGAPHEDVVVPRAEGPDATSGEVSARVAAAYDAIAVTYAELNALMPEALVGLGQRALARAGVGARVLDVGCGPAAIWPSSKRSRAKGRESSESTVRPGC